MRLSASTRLPVAATAVLAAVLTALAVVAGPPATEATSGKDTGTVTAHGGNAVATVRPVAARAPRGKKATVVLVHGAFADASGWNDVILDLKRRGYKVHAWANPLRGLASDAAYLRTFLSTLPGPVILVGHSYGGAVVGEASTGNPNVVALVYVAGYGLAEGETIAAANELGGGHSDVIDNIVVRPYPGAPEGDGDAIIRQSRFREVFAADLPRRLTRAMAAAQRPAALSSLVVPAGEPGWTTIPSYFMVANDDRVIPPEAQRVMAARMKATRRGFDSSHALLLTRSAKVVDFVLRADREH